MAWNKHLKLASVILFLSLIALTACRISIKMNGSALDYTVYKTIRVSDFPIRAALVYPPLQQTFETELLDYITKNTRLRTTDGAADIELEGEITAYNLTPQAVTENAYASMTRLTISVRVRYIDNKADNNDADQTFSAYRDFDSSEMLTDVQDQLCEEISKELVELIFNATLGNW
ncbi:MAG: LptE family protein [Muribaculaceae bacterium]|nr:LptE family protein [Muribaculaceae bacterium]